MRYKKCSIVIVVLLLFISGCTTMSKEVKITVILKSTTSSFFKAVKSGANAAAKEYNLEINCVGPDKEEDYISQNEMIETAIKENVDVIVLSAIDYNKTVEPVEKAIDQGIKVVIIDSDVNSDKVKIRISTNNYEAGIMAGEALLKIPSKTINIGLINFNANTANGQQREMGFRKTVLEDSRVASLNVINVPSDIQVTIDETKKLLTTNPEINAIVTFNEWTSLGVGEAIGQLEYQDRVTVIAFDNNPQSIEMLESGEVDALIVQTPFVIGYLGVEQAYLVANHKLVDENTYTKTVTITKDNLWEKENQKIVFPFD